MSLYPLVIDIGSVDEIAAMACVGIQHFVGLSLVGVTTKDVATKA
jgi:hypothetical protein